jgi:chromosome condensin MukBEF MukE localization factor
MLQSVPKVAVTWNIRQTVHQWRSVSRVNCLGRTTVVLTIDERVFLVGHVLRNGDKYTENVQQKLAQRFPDAQVAHRNAVRSLVNKFRETGSVQDAPRSSRPSTSEETVLDIRDRLLQSPSKSV